MMGRVVHEVYLSSGQAARLLGISKNTLLRAVRRGEIAPAAWTPAGYARFRMGDVESYADRLSAPRPSMAVAGRGAAEMDAARIDSIGRPQASAPGDAGPGGGAHAFEKWARSVYAAIASGVVVLSAAGDVVEANAAAQEILGLPLKRLRGRPFARAHQAITRHDGADLPADGHPVDVALQRKRPVRNVTVRMMRLDGQDRWLQLDAVPLLDDGGAVAQLVLSLVDFTERRQAEEALKHQALHDALTGLPNRSLFHDRLEHSLLVARREHSPLALLAIDLNRFKEVNDTLGHHYGDLLLQQIGERIAGVLRTADTVARLSGDEFAVILPATSAVDAAQVVGRLSTALEQPFAVDGQSLTVGGSIGIARYPDHATDALALLHCADVAMYAAKRSGGGYAVYAPTQDQHSFARLALEHDLRHALLQDDEFVLYYQPILDQMSGEVCQVEVLLRWQHPELGFIPPDRFIPLAEQTGLIGPLTRWVLDRALRQSQDWLRAGLSLGLSVNLSMSSLHDGQITDVLSTLLRRYEVAPGRLTLEITESTVMADPARAIAILGSLGQLGVRIAIDDFGTGYSSLSYLKQLPVDEIKIDKSFVLGLYTEAKEAPLVCSMIAMARVMGLEVVAEGVETKEAWDLLQSLGGVLMQGYYLSRPRTALELERWMQTLPQPARAATA